MQVPNIKLDPKELAKQLGPEGLKDLLKQPEVAKLRASDPELSKQDKEMNKLTREQEAADDKKELERIAMLFEGAHSKPFPFSQSITKIGSSFADSKASVYVNYMVEGRAEVLRTSVSKVNITESQFQKRVEKARKRMMVIATYAINLDLATLQF